MLYQGIVALLLAAFMVNLILNLRSLHRLGERDGELSGELPFISVLIPARNEESDIAICVERKDHPVANLYRHDARRIHQRLHWASRANACSQCWYNCRGEIESLYRPVGLMKSLPTLLRDRGAARRP